jgi:hypothetical protein
MAGKREWSLNRMRLRPIIEAMISTATTHLQAPVRTDGGLRDPDPTRRAARLAAAGVRVERRGAFDHVVRIGESEITRRWTRSAAERIALAHA